MIVVVEGPSGAGKTTWCRTHGRSYALLEELPDHSTVPSEPEAQARIWVERNVIERRDGSLKLYESWLANAKTLRAPERDLTPDEIRAKLRVDRPDVGADEPAILG